MPEGWAWCRITNIAKTELGKTVDIKKNKGTLFKYLCALNVKWFGFDFSTLKEIRLEENEKERYLVKKGDLLICEGGDVGRAAIWDSDDPIYYQNALHRVRFYGNINQYFYLYTLNYYKSFGLIDDVSGGVTIKHFTQNSIQKLLFPLPPLAEQKLIVTEVERIFAQIDLLEQNKSDLQAAVKQAKSKVLDLAIHGKLVPQDANDEPASVLLEKLRAEKEEQIAKGNLKHDKNDSYIYRGSDNRHYQRFADGREEDVSDEIPFELPDSWSWCKLGELCLKIKRGKSPKYIEKSCVMAFAQKCNQKDNSTSLKKALYIDESTVKKYPEDEKMQFNDVVINSTGTGTLGRVGIFNCKIPEGITAVYPDSHVTTVRFRSNLNKHYCYYFVKTKQLYLETKGEGSTNQKELKPDTISGLYIPLPPLDEQQRIVTKIKELFTLLDRIQSDIS